MEVIVTFLAMLELVKIRAIRIFQDRPQEPIVIEAAVGVDEAAEAIAKEEEEIEEEWHGS
jgi:chromatin segregation and condensation protein Rec8/ScpA/Scc1 (kleisin family)